MSRPTRVVITVVVPLSKLVRSVRDRTLARIAREAFGPLPYAVLSVENDALSGTAKVTLAADNGAVPSED